VVAKANILMESPKQLCLLGVSFRTAPVAVREALRFQPDAATALLREAVAAHPGREALIISTCNRTEFYLAAESAAAIDLRHRLEMPPCSEGQLPMNVVVRTDDGAVSLLVDEIGDVVEIQHESYERTPETLKGVARELVTGVYKLKERLLLILDTERAVSQPAGFNRAQAKAA